MYDFNFTTTRRTIGGDNKKNVVNRRHKEEKKKRRNFTIQAFLIFMKMINWTLEGISIYCNSSLVSHELWWITFSRYNIFIHWINCKTHDASSEPHETHKTMWCGLLFFVAEQQKKTRKINKTNTRHWTWQWLSQIGWWINSSICCALFLVK